jgi:hypothetical protein
MSHDYAMSRVRDALEKSEGNHLKAQRLLLSWIENDQSLLLGLVAPHLQGIVTHAVNHVTNPQKKDNLQDDGLSFGAALAQSLEGETATFGQPAPRNVGKPGKASQNHVDAINAIAGAAKNKGKKK